MPSYLPVNAGVALSEAIAEAYASAKTADPVLVTLEFRHPSFTDDAGNPTSAWVVNDFRNLVATDENAISRTYIGVPFRSSSPSRPTVAHQRRRPSSRRFVQSWSCDQTS